MASALLVPQFSGNVDLSGYATQQWVKDQSYATQSWVNGRGFLTSHQSLSGYATQSWVKDQLNLAPPSASFGTIVGAVAAQGLTNAGNGLPIRFTCSAEPKLIGSINSIYGATMTRVESYEGRFQNTYVAGHVSGRIVTFEWVNYDGDYAIIAFS